MSATARLRSGPRRHVGAGMLAMALLVGAAAAAEVELPAEIRSVRVDSDRREDAEQVVELLQLEVGSTLDPVRLRDLISAFYAAGRVEWLRVAAAEAEGGVEVVVEVNFRATLSGVAVHGPDLVRRIRVRRWLRLEPGEPVTAAAIEVKRRGVERRLRDRGFVDAEVEAYLDYDRSTNTVLAEFVVNEGEPHVLRKVVIEGLPADVEADAVRPAVTTGTRLTSQFEERVRERTEGNLRRMGYWEAEVTAVEQVAEGPQVDLVVRIDPGQHYRLELEAPPERRQVAEAAAPDPSRDEIFPAQTEALEEEVAERLQESGYLLADVSAELVPADDAQVLELVVDPGDKLRIAAVEFPGADSLSHRQLSDAVAVSAGAVGGRFQQQVSESSLEADRQALIALYHGEGFPYASVAPPQIATVTGEDAVRIVFPIVEGPRWIVTHLQFEDLPVEAAAELEERPLELGPGSPWSPAAVERAQRRLEQALADTGYPDGRVEVDVDTSVPGDAVLSFRVVPGSFVRVGDVIIAGLEHTRESLVAGVVERAGVVAGEPLSRRRLMEAQRGLYQLGIFRRVEVVPMPGHERREERNIVVRLEEGEQRSVLFGIGYSTRDAARFTVGWSHLNLLGRAYGFTVEASLSQSRQQYSLSLRKRRPFGLPVPGHLAVYRTNEILADRELLRRGLWIDFGDRLRRPLRPWFRYEYEIVQPDQLVEPRVEDEFSESKVASITPSLEWDTRDNPLAPDRGLFASASAQYAFPAFEADEHFFRVQTGATLYGPLWNGFGAAGLRVGVIDSFDPEPGLPDNLQIPFAYRLFAGGRTSHRAFATDELGVPGQTIVDGVPVGGNALVLLNLEYRRHVVGSLWASAFVDAGNVWASAGDVEPSEIRWGAGLGLQFRTPAGPLRAEYAWKLDREPGESGGQFYISFGVPF